MNIHADFNEGMSAHAARREHDADAVEFRLNARERKLDEHEAAAMKNALDDTVIVESLRLIAWRTAGATNFIPKAWPLGITAEIQWRYINADNVKRSTQ